MLVRAAARGVCVRVCMHIYAKENYDSARTISCEHARNPTHVITEAEKDNHLRLALYASFCISLCALRFVSRFALRFALRCLVSRFALRFARASFCISLCALRLVCANLSRIMDMESRLARDHMWCSGN